MRNEIREFEKLLKQDSRTIMGDAFIRNYIEDLLKNIRTQVLLKVITPYTRIRIQFIAQELNITPAEVEQLLVALILDGQVRAAPRPSSTAQLAPLRAVRSTRPRALAACDAGASARPATTDARRLIRFLACVSTSARDIASRRSRWTATSTSSTSCSSSTKSRATRRSTTRSTSGGGN